MKESNCPIRLQDHCAERRATDHKATTPNTFKLQGPTPCTTFTGEKYNISSLCQFDWHGWVYYKDSCITFPVHKERLGNTLGPSKRDGNETCQ